MNLAKIWSATLGTMQVQTSRQEFNTWLRVASLLSIENGTATIGVPSTFYKEGLENRYIGPLRELLSDLVGLPVLVRVAIAPTQMTRADVRLAPREHGQDSVSMETLDDQPTERRPPSSGYYGGGAANWPPEPSGDGGSAAAHPTSYTNGSGSTLGGFAGGNGYASGVQNGGYPGAASNNYGGAPTAVNSYDRRAVQQLDLTTAMRSGMLNARYTFDRFIVGSSNRLASAACMAVAEHPAQAYNPLFLYGGVGLGKTHLLHAIGNHALDRDPEINVLYITSEKFTNDLINAIRRQQTEEFRLRYRGIDVLLIDDIQFIAGKESTQEEFFHTFNALHAAAKQIVISSDRPPKAILTLAERLRSRFEWGLIVDVQTPDVETRTAILRTKAETMSTLIPAEVLDFLAHRIQSNIRELEGCLNRVVAYAQMTGSTVSIETATSALTELLDTTRRRRLTADAILKEVAEFYGIDLRALQGRGRSRNVVIPRQVIMYLLREETDSSLMDIGRFLGGRDHTTIIYGCDKIGEEVNTNARLRQEIMTIRDRLYQGGAAK
ncbi:MAG: chromosomal replication initiator protein DnaA [Roseiflexaceae bacterium]|nr:chromosomal replication initiator protein DnaA [Roseiflexaceae bacterium]